MEDQPTDDRGDDIGDGSHQSDDTHAEFRMLEVPGIDRYRLSPTKAEEQQCQRTERIDVRQRIER